MLLKNITTNFKIVILLLLIPFILLSKNVNFSFPDNNKIVIKIKNLSELLAIEDSNYFHLNSKYSFRFKEDGFSFDKLRIPIALPKQFKKNIYIQVTKSISVPSSFKISNLQENIKIDFISKMRDIPISVVDFNPFFIDNGILKIIDQAEIYISFDDNLEALSSDYDFYSNLPNLKQINFISYKNEHHKKAFMQFNNWYNPDLDYLKITTSKVGIAKIKANEIISIFPKFNELNLKFFHIYYLGEEIPLYINSNDTILNSNDEIFFLTNRVSGDSTWLSNYTDSAVYYFSYDETKIGRRYEKFPELSNVNNELNTLEVNKHFEEEHEYFWGDFNLQWDVENIKREKWLWDEIVANGNDEFNFDFITFPKDSLELKINLESIYFNKDFLTKHRFFVTLNGDTIDKNFLDTGSIKDFIYRIPEEQIIPGLNRLKIKMFTEYNGNDIIIPNQIGIDFCELNYNSQPIINYFDCNYFIPGQDKNFKLSSSGFIDNKIIVIDSLNSFFAFDTAYPVIFLSGGITEKYISLKINDTSLYNEKNSFIIASIENQKITINKFNDYTTAVNYLKSKTFNGYYLFINNIQMPLPQELKNILSDLSATKLEEYNQGSVWIFGINFLSNQGNFEEIKHNEKLFFNKEIEFSESNHYKLSINLIKDKDYKLYFSSDNNLIKASISLVNQTNLSSTNHQADALIIYHPNFLENSEKLAEYRKSQGINALLIDINDIYKEFNFGIKDPKAIKNFLKFTFNFWRKPAPKFVLLIGDANWDARNKLEQSENFDFIPTYGWPPSDYWYSQLDDKPNDIHDLFIGRLPVYNNEQLNDIINKLIEYDTIPKQPWMKRFLSLTGGQNQDEINIFYEDMLILLFDYWFLNEFSGDTAFVYKQLGEREKEANKIISEIDKGAVWVNFFGHGSPQVFDMDGWHADKLNNKGKYSFFTTISCNTAAFAEPTGNSRDEEYVLIKDKGFIAAGGSTNLGLITPGLLILSDMLDIILNSKDKQRFIGEFLNNAKIRLLMSDSISQAFAKQYVLIGDPMIKIRIPLNYDLYILEKDVKITNKKQQNLINQSDSLIKIEGIVYNNGYCFDDTVNLKLIHQFNAVSDTLYYSFNGICLKENFNFTNIPIMNQVGIHYVQIFIQTKDSLFLAYKSEFKVFEDGLLPVEPLPYWSISSDSILIRMINPTNRANVDYEFKISCYINGKDTILYYSKPNEVFKHSTHIDWKINDKLSQDYVYYLHSRVINHNTNQTSRWMVFPFTVTNESFNPVIINLKNEIFKNLGMTNCYLDENSLIQYKTKYLPISIKSSRGQKDTIRLAEIKFNDTLYIITPSESNAPVGINLIVISPENQQVKAVKYFYTWGDEHSTIDLVNFLNDSISDGDWLALASCGSAWRQFYYTGLKDSNAIGSFYTFKNAMSKFGAKKIWQLPDSIDNPFVSYCFAGRKNHNGKTIEFITLDGSYIFVNDSIDFFPNYAEIKLPEIFGFDSLISINLQGVDVKNNKVYLILYDVNDTTKNEKYDFEQNNLSLSNFTLNNAESVSGIISFKREDEQQRLNLDNIKIYLSPTPEIAIDSENSNLEHNRVIRADTIKALINVVNLSLRQDAFEVNNELSNKLLSGNVIKISNVINQIYSNQNFTDSLELSTLFFDNINNLLFSTNYDNKIKEIYKFNNNTEFFLEILRDTILPILEIYSDSVKIFDNSFISLQPKMKFLLFDNSYEPVEIEAIKVRLNGLSLKEDNSKFYHYENLNIGHLKSQLEIHLDSLLDYDNLIEVYFLDAAGNRDTVEYHLFTTINAFIYNELIYPNPFTDNNIISFYYKASDNQGIASIGIFDINGKLIRKIEKSLIIGENKIEFDGRDDYGNPIPPGIYFYSIKIISSNYAKPKFGKMLKK